MLSRILKVVFPYQCWVCGKIVYSEGGFCEDCFKKVHFVNSCCSHCGRPLSIGNKAWEICQYCEYKDVPKSRFVFLYDEATKPVILKFKHADMTFAVPQFARWMVKSGADVLDGADALVPVPVHRLRLIKRKYNQAAMLAKNVAKLSHKEFVYDNLRRIRNTPSQGDKNPLQRRLNVKNAFSLCNPIAVKGKTIVIVDDVVTTGATTEECKKILLDAGAKEVRVLALAVVCKD